MDAFVENTIKEIREKVGDGKVLLHFQVELIHQLQHSFSKSYRQAAYLRIRRPRSSS